MTEKQRRERPHSLQAGYDYTICIPPSWDLVQKYSGSHDENADGFDKELYDKGKLNYAGDLGEAEFHRLMRRQELGGILIGDISSYHLLHGKTLAANERLPFMMSDDLFELVKRGMSKTIL
jgi:hypothetical protein